MKSTGPCLIVFARCPEPGRTKTRLIGRLGAVSAADLQRAMTRHILGWAADWAQQAGGRVVVEYAGGDPNRMRRMFGDRFTYRPQCDGDLGHRMATSMDRAFTEGADRVLIVGSDAPEVDRTAITEAFDRLDNHDLTIDPAADGGYVLLGSGKPLPSLFNGPDWGGPQVLEQTLRIASQNDLSVGLGPVRRDVDRPEDLGVWETARAHRPPQIYPSISVIVPTLNEAEHLTLTLEAVCSFPDAELLISDGGSIDRTRRIAESFGATVIDAPRGRAAQLNAGARAASGQLLLFCHADTILPSGYDRHVRDTLGEPGVIAGAFGFKMDLAGPGPRRIERAVRRRCLKRQLPYGDQGLFFAAEDFQSLGMFPQQPIMEDYELMRRARRRGRVVLAPAEAVTSGRYWESCGIWQTTVINAVTIAGYRLGLPHRWLRKFRSGWLQRAAGRESHAS
ncbi:MAG: TIGR04283 family arsenosugar biosynthesis glycosyltransferase [Phycisphaeraceae bacterium]|nr:TIGR04283 family arsenosugar biosynthesis glycosyltransferase [Phycisphaeraceae bacterium]